jgi:hypothetical protein
MRYEVAAAYVMGVGLPALEVCRRGSDFSRIAAYADDFLAGALLLAAAVCTSRRKPIGPVLLVAAWGIVCGGFYSSFFGQLENAAPRDVSGLPNSTVVAIKGAIYAAAILALGFAVRYLAGRRISQSDHSRGSCP